MQILVKRKTSLLAKDYPEAVALVPTRGSRPASSGPQILLLLSFLLQVGFSFLTVMKA